MISQSWEGACYCGSVRYRASGAPKFVAHDHCSICRRIAGAAYVTWVGFREEQVEVLAGREALRTFAQTETAHRQFCGACGSHLFFRSARWPGEVHATLATIQEPIGLVPKAHVYFSDRASWSSHDETLPRFGGGSGMEPL